MHDDRLMSTDRSWARFAAVVGGIKRPSGAPPLLSGRDFVEAILHMARTGCPWRDLPARFGEWDAVCQRFRRWQARGIWATLLARLPADLAAVRDVLSDSTVIRAHQHAAGAPAKKGGRRRRRWGRSRGGFGTKIHLAPADGRTALAATLSPGQHGDSPRLSPPLAAVPAACPIAAAVADKVYESDRNRAVLAAGGIEAVMPLLNCRKWRSPTMRRSTGGGTSSSGCSIG